MASDASGHRFLTLITLSQVWVASHGAGLQCTQEYMVTPVAHIVPVSTFPPDSHYSSSQGLQLCRPGELLLTSGSVPKIF